MEPDLEKMRIDMYSDADFTSLYITEEKMDPISAKSITGVLLTFENVPILWTSKLQTEASLSTIKAEYITLSQGMRELVSTRRLIANLGKRMSYKLDKVSYISKVWDDNTGTQNLSNSKGPLMILRIKHIKIKYNWFRLMIKLNKIEILCIDTRK